MTDYVEGRNVSLYPSDWAIVEQADIGAAGLSATLRRIIREWNRNRNAPHHKLVDSGVSYVTDAHANEA